MAQSSSQASSSFHTQDSSLSLLTNPLLLHPVTEEDFRTLRGVCEDESKASTPHSRPGRLKRPHTKSRGGCLKCKSRRIKCQETKPACANCIHKDLECVYPTLGTERRMLHRTDTQSLALAPLVESASSPASIPQTLSLAQFTVDDLRFFHHFLLAARPHLPFGNERQWMTDIPAFAHDCPHLMHAILSLGATHYSLIAPNGSQHFPSAIAHRGKALQYLNIALAKGRNATTTEMDGILATCYTLCFQSHHMDDGLVDFAVMVRGCGIITNWILENSRSSNMFHIQTNAEVIALVTSWLPAGPSQVKEQAAVDESLANLALLEPLLQTSAHFDFYYALRRTYFALKSSVREAFTALTDIYLVWNSMGNVEFLTFIAPGNYVSRALFMHYITIDVFMRPVYIRMNQHSRVMFASAHFIIYKWADAVYHSLPVWIRELVRGQADLVAADLEVELNNGHKSPEWARELAFLGEWLRRRPTARAGLTCESEASLII